MLITLTTDFGLQDSFVGIMKGVIARINPNVGVVDLTHGIPAQDVLAGALTLRHSLRYFPRGTIHVAVVDPGVGSARRSLLIERDGNYFVGPDNGLLSLAIGEKKPDRVVQLSNPAYHLQPTSATFHARDVFAPAAAHLSLGVPLLSFGEKLETYEQLVLPKPIGSRNGVDGEIIYIDNFGNLFTNIEEHDLTGLAAKRCEIVIGPIRIRGLAPNYAAARSGDFVAVVNSWGLLEIAVYRGNAQQNSGVKIGDKLKLVIVS
jgi:S-adenosyl-L-methionine hydrolase (adenosine-forming)